MKKYFSDYLPKNKIYVYIIKTNLKMIGEQIDFSSYADPKLRLRPILSKVGKVAKVLCPNPNINISPTTGITLGCR